MRRDVEDYATNPRGHVNVRLVIERGEDILRFVISIKLKESTASELFRRLIYPPKWHAKHRENLVGTLVV